LKWLIGLFTGFFLQILSFLVKRFGIATLVLAFQISTATIFIAFLLSATIYLVNFLFSLWNLVKTVVSIFSTVPSVSGSAFGISNTSLVSSFFGFLHASGLASGFETAGNLLIGFLSVYFVIQAYKIYMFSIREIRKIVTTLLTLMTR